MNGQETIERLTAKINELEHQLENRTIELEKANNDFHSFSYKVSHDLHAPLRAVQNYISMINSDYVGKVLDEDAQRLISRIMNNTEEMKQMLDGLLEFVRTGKKELTIQRLNMNHLVHNICFMLQQTYSDRKLTFQMSSLSDANGDEELIKKVWTHLISNAVRFTGKREESIIEINSEEKDGQVIYSVKDNGDGFDMSYYDKLFGIFQRLHHKTEFEGAGVGLAIVNNIVDRHKGKVWGEAKVKEGAVFYFTLPA